MQIASTHKSSASDEVVMQRRPSWRPGATKSSCSLQRIAVYPMPSSLHAYETAWKGGAWSRGYASRLQIMRGSVAVIRRRRTCSSGSLGSRRRMILTGPDLPWSSLTKEMPLTRSGMRSAPIFDSPCRGWRHEARSGEWYQD